MIKQKVLWADINIHRFDFSGMLSAIPDIEVVFFDNATDAIKELKNNNYRLVISGNRFADGGDGISFFKTLTTFGLNPEFLLLTGEPVSKDDPCFLLPNFTYARKEDMFPDVFTGLIEELLNKGGDVSDIHLRLKAIRLYSKLSEAQFASLLGSTAEKVESFESGLEVPSSYIVSVCHTFNIPLSYISSFSYELFLKRMDELTFELKQKGGM